VKNQFKYFFIAIMLYFGLFSFACSFKPRAIGMNNEIVVLADENDWNLSGNALKSVFEQIVVTPQKEKIFNVYHPDLILMKTNQKHRNLIIMGTLQSEGIIGQFIKNMLSEEAQRSILTGENYVFKRENEWARDQLLLVFVGKDNETLNKKLIQNQRSLFKLFDDSNNESLLSSMYEKAEQKEITQKLYDKYDFSIRVQHDYQLKEFDDRNLLFFRRLQPDRMIFIHWIDTIGVYTVPNAWAWEKRNEISKELNGSEIFSDYTTAEFTTFQDFPAVKLQGGWWNPEKGIGGPLLNYTFYDDKTSRIYILDMTVFAPDYAKEKEPFIRQLNIIAHTFNTDTPYLENR